MKKESHYSAALFLLISLGHSQLTPTRSCLSDSIRILTVGTLQIIRIHEDASLQQFYPTYRLIIITWICLPRIIIVSTIRHMIRKPGNGERKDSMSITGKDGRVSGKKERI